MTDNKHSKRYKNISCLNNWVDVVLDKLQYNQVTPLVALFTSRSHVLGRGRRRRREIFFVKISDNATPTLTRELNTVCYVVEMASFKSARDLLLVGVQEGLLDEEFLLLHDLNTSTNAEYQYKVNSKVNSDKERIRMFYLAYQIHTSNCSGLSTILKI